jgi:hypothetical protein
MISMILITACSKSDTGGGILDVPIDDEFSSVLDVIIGDDENISEDSAPDYLSLYSEILDEYRSIVQNYDPETDLDLYVDTHWFSTVFFLSAGAERGKESFGYGFLDINGDGIPELFLLNPIISAIYTIYEGEARLLLSVAFRTQIEAITNDGTIIIWHGGGSQHLVFYRIYEGEPKNVSTWRKEYEAEKNDYEIFWEGESGEFFLFEDQEEAKKNWDSAESENDISGDIKFIPLLDANDT